MCPIKLSAFIAPCERPAPLVTAVAPCAKLWPCASEMGLHSDHKQKGEKRQNSGACFDGQSLEHLLLQKGRGPQHILDSDGLPSRTQG
jgi:hypothetical protein